LKKKEKFSLMVGEDLYYHAKAENLAKLVALIEATCAMDVVMTPPKSNALGVALICDLDDEATGYTIGYNEKGDFRLSALGDVEGENGLDMPAMNQQEGTLTSIGKRVLPTNAGLEYEGYELNDIMKALGHGERETIDWTPLLPTSKGFKAVAFDSLAHTFSNAGVDNRGYRLDVTSTEVTLPTVEKFDESAVLEGEIAYRCNPARQFNDFTDKCHEIFEPFALYASPQKAESLGEKVEVVFANGSITLEVIADEKIVGDIVKVPDFKSAKEVYGLFGQTRYQTVTIRKV
jgi:NADH-quinone oxidoreductase subunit G